MSSIVLFIYFSFEIFSLSVTVVVYHAIADKSNLSVNFRRAGGKEEARKWIIIEKKERIYYNTCNINIP